MASKSKKKTQGKTTKKTIIKRSTNSNSLKQKASRNMNSTKSRIKPLVDDIPSTEYDKIFEQKLSEQYRIFRNLKESHIQTKKFIQIFVVLLVIILIAVLLISFSA